MAGYKRRNFFIDREFQGRTMFKAFLGVLLGCVLLALLIALFSANTLSVTYDNYHLSLGTTPKLLLSRILNAGWLFILLAGVLVSLLTLFLSHRVAGPFYRLEKTMTAMVAKDLSDRVNLRKKDEGKGLAGKINELARTLQDTVLEMRGEAEAIRKSCNGGTEAQLQEILRHSDRLLGMLDEFKLKRD